MQKYCKHCGNLLGEAAAFCAKCGTKVAAANIPEQSIPEPLPDSDGTLLGDLEHAKAYFQQKANEYETIIKLGKEFADANAPDSGAKTLWQGIVVCVASVILSNLVWPPLFLGIFLGAILVLIGLTQILRGNPQIKRFHVEQAERTAQIENLHVQLKEYFDHYPNCPVAYEYSNPALIEELIAYIRTGRAETIKEAINCYTNDVHNKELQELQKIAAEKAKRASRPIV